MTTYRYFDTGDKAVDELLSQLDHMSRRYDISDVIQFDDWLIGFIERWKALPEPYQVAIKNSAYIGDLHHRLGLDWVNEKFEELQTALGVDLENVLATNNLAGRSNVYGDEYQKKGKYGDRTSVDYPDNARDYETTGEVIKRICKNLLELDSLFYDGPERQKLLLSLSSEAQGHRQIRGYLNQLNKLLSKKRIDDLSKATVDAYGIIYRIKDSASHWHRRRNQ